MAQINKSILDLLRDKAATGEMVTLHSHTLNCLLDMVEKPTPFAWVLKRTSEYQLHDLLDIYEEGKTYDGIVKKGLSARQWAEEMAKICSADPTENPEIFPVYRIPVEEGSRVEGEEGPIFDAHGYPSEHTLNMIEKWDPLDLSGLLDFVKSAWDAGCGEAWYESAGAGDRDMHLATGGWSGNEDLIMAMQRNLVAWSLLWQSSHRGGHYVLRLPSRPAI